MRRLAGDEEQLPEEEAAVSLQGSKDKALEMLRQLGELVKHWSGEEWSGEKGLRRVIEAGDDVEDTIKAFNPADWDLPPQSAPWRSDALSAHGDGIRRRVTRAMEGATTPGAGPTERGIEQTVAKIVQGQLLPAEERAHCTELKRLEEQWQRAI